MSKIPFDDNIVFEMDGAKFGIDNKNNNYI